MTRRRLGLLLLTVPAVVLWVLVAERWHPLLGLDARTDRLVHRGLLHHHAVVSAVHAFTHVGDPLVVTSATAVLAILLLLRGRRSAALYVVLVRLVALVPDSGLKHLVARHRPVLAEPFAHASGWSFPSGHALGSAALWGSLAVVAAARLGRAIALAVAVTVPVLIAVTRVLLGVHYPSDVVAGLAIGWLVAAALAPLSRSTGPIDRPDRPLALRPSARCTATERD